MKAYIVTVGDRSASTIALEKSERMSAAKDICVVIGLDSKWAAALQLRNGSARLVAARNYGDNIRPRVTVYDTMDNVPPRMYRNLIRQLQTRGTEFLKKIRNAQAKSRLRSVLNAFQCPQP